MFHPVGHQSPTIYWRRRLFFVASVVALLALAGVTTKVLLSKNSAPAAAGMSSSSTARTTPATHPPSTSASTSPPTSPSTSASTSISGGSPQCTASELAVAAVTSAQTFTVGQEMTLSVQVTNTGKTPCTQNLADSQIVLKVYNGVSRVWGSHDCQIEPGTDLRTLLAGMTVKISLVWSGRSSQPDCAGLRQQVGAGTYTLYASLSGQEGKAAQFAIK